jgi:hypothetical protein
MKSKVGMIIVALFMAVALSAVAASVASAADEWFIGGTKLSQLSSKNAPLATAVPLDESIILTINPLRGEAEDKVECKGLSSTEPYISAGGGGMARAVIFEKCKITKPTVGCELEAEGATKNLRNITTNPLAITTLLMGSPTKVNINVKPLTGKTFATVPFVEGEMCLGGIGEVPVTGSVLVLSSDGALGQTVHTVMAQGSLENNSLEVAGDKSILEGGLALVKLASGANWSFHS